MAPMPHAMSLPLGRLWSYICGALVTSDARDVKPVPAALEGTACGTMSTRAILAYTWLYAMGMKLVPHQPGHKPKTTRPERRGTKRWLRHFSTPSK